MRDDSDTPRPTPGPEFFSVKQAAIYINLSQQTIRRLVKAGKIKSHQFGRQIRIHKRDLDDYISRNKQGCDRPMLQSIAKTHRQIESTDGHLWINYRGRPMSSQAIRLRIKFHTRHAFGKAIWPHLFRDCAVTELVDSAPEEIGIAPDLLGHTDLQTTRKHYIQGQGITAHARVQAVIVRRRVLASRSRPARDGRP
jgi:excisionase family DNA binding protein